MAETVSTPKGIARRNLLLAGGMALAATPVRSFAQAPAPGEAMSRWDAAPSIPLWTGAAPNGGFRKQPLPDNSPPIFLRNIEQPFLRVFRPDKPNGRSLLSIPGGAYTFVSIANEGVDVARDMTARGYTVFVLVYRLPGEGWAGREDVPLQDAQRAVRLIRARSAEFGCDPEQLYAVGFSAGGHLAASLATGFAEPIYQPHDQADGLSAKPRAVGLIYPVISQTEGIGHAESTLRLLGKDPPMLSIVRRSPDLHVSAETPPTFLVHAIDDPAVPLENSLLMMGALRGNRRPVEAHYFERGGHGFGTGVRDQPTAAWPDLFAAWMDTHAA
ncbi:MAG TPA: alpha/beta hydrolase [Croceibacterium sp.]|nr:alpha/beta hydrolase [Croceibacterium sp.]